MAEDVNKIGADLGLSDQDIIREVVAAHMRDDVDLRWGGTVVLRPVSH